MEPAMSMDLHVTVGELVVLKAEWHMEWRLRKHFLMTAQED
jgi:hypothetical protein